MFLNFKFFENESTKFALRNPNSPIEHLQHFLSHWILILFLWKVERFLSYEYVVKKNMRMLFQNGFQTALFGLIQWCSKVKSNYICSIVYWYDGTIENWNLDFNIKTLTICNFHLFQVSWMRGPLHFECIFCEIDLNFTVYFVQLICILIDTKGGIPLHCALHSLHTVK